MNFLVIGAFFGFSGVVAGAFGTHGLRGHISPEMLNIFEIGVRYQIYHALALLVTGFLADRSPSFLIFTTGCLFISGTIIFSGTLYILSLTNIRWWGAITPLGGFVLLVGWICLMCNSWSTTSR